MSYITTSDIKSNLISGFDVQPYIDESGEEINDLAQKLGVRDPDDIQTPVHYKIKRYAISFVLMRLAQDKIGTNSPELALEKYRELYALYKGELKELYSQITYEMLTGNVTTITGRTASYGFYRG